jgi:hypothetical protein
MADEGTTGESMPEGSSEGPPDLTPEEVERLRVERDDLEREVERLHDRPAKRHRMRRITAAVLVVLTIVSLTLAVPGTWVRRTLVNTDAYVATVAPLASEPAVQEYLARQITINVFAALGVEQRLEGVLQDRAERLAFLAGPIANAVQGFVQDEVQKLVASSAFQTLWTDANRFAQQQVVAVLSGNGDLVSLVGGTVVLNLLPMVNEALSQVSSIATDLVGRSVTLPTITAQEIPADAIAKIESATGLQLPDSFGQIKIVGPDDLAAAQDAFTLANRLVFLTVVLSLLFFVLALVVATRRRRALIQIMGAWAVILVAERRGAIAAGDAIVSDARPENQAAAEAVVDTISSGLLNYTKWLLVIAIATLVIALITGPYPWAIRLRGWVKDLFGAIVGVARGADRPAITAWVADHRDPLLLADAAVAILLLLVLDVGWLGFLAIALVGAGVALAIWRIAEQQLEPAADAEPPGS